MNYNQKIAIKSGQGELKISELQAISLSPIPYKSPISDPKNTSTTQRKLNSITHALPLLHFPKSEDLDLKKSIKTKFNDRFQNINIHYYTELTKTILQTLYPRICEVCKIPMTKDVRNRENSCRCPRCHKISSRTAGTPLVHLKVPMWTFSYILQESVQLFPQLLSSATIQRKLGVSANTALNLKRRLQIVFAEDILPAIKYLMAEEIRTAFSEDYRLPVNEDLQDITRTKPVVSIDTVALYSCSQRANSYRARYRNHTGQTASLYLSDSVALEREDGKYQIGVLANTIAIRGGAVIYDSIPDSKQRTLQPLLKFLPVAAPVMSDEGMPWLSRLNPNHRMVNHSARAKDRKRNVWSRNRFSTVNHVNNQCAEANQKVIKYAMISAYSYISPKYSQLYLTEASCIKGLRVYGWDRVIEARSKLRGSDCGVSKTCEISRGVEVERMQLESVIANCNDVQNFSKVGGDSCKGALGNGGVRVRATAIPSSPITGTATVKNEKGICTESKRAIYGWR